MSNPTATEQVTHFAVDGPDVQKMIWDHLLPAVTGQPKDHAIIGMLALSALLMKPDATMDELSAAIQGATQVLVTALSTTGKVN